MAKLIQCECGFVARGETDEQVVSAIEAHMRTVVRLGRFGSSARTGGSGIDRAGTGR